METVSALTDSSWDEVLEASARIWDRDDLPNVLEIAQRGERIYEERYRRDYEAQHFGKFLAINVQSEQCHLGSTPREAFFEALRAVPGACLFLVRVGFPGAWEQKGRFRRGCDCNGVY
jgi:hypothetical protein